VADVTVTDPLVVAVVLNTNRRDDTLACLASLARSTYRNLSILVLDNASTDGSAQAVHAAYPDAKVLVLTENRGYAGNNNVGIAAALEAGAAWVFVLNEDTEVAPDCVARLVAAGESEPRVAMTGPMVYHFDERDVIQSAGVALGAAWDSQHLGKNESDRGQFPETRPVLALSGCAILVRAEAIRDFGALDERFFYYWEETDWCLRAARHGWTLLHVPRARLWHKGVQRNYRPAPSVTYYNTRNHFLMMSKLDAPLPAWAAAWFQTARTLTSWSVKPRWRHLRAHRDAMWQGTWDFLRGRWGRRPA
jgi:GT2 family glycosyltransferase